MPDELDVGKLVARIVLENDTSETVEEVKKDLTDVQNAVKSTTPRVNITADTTVVKAQAKNAIDDIAAATQASTPKIDIQFDGAAAAKQIEEVLAKIGIEGSRAEEIIKKCFSDKQPIITYQQQLDITADKIQQQKDLLIELEKTANKTPSGRKSAAEIDKAAASIDGEKIKLKELELQYDKTYAAQDSYITKTATKFVSATDQAAQKQEQFNEKMSKKTSVADMAMGIGMLTSSMRTANRVSPGLIDNIRTIIFQVNLAKRAVTSAASTPMAVATGIVAAIGIITTVVTNFVSDIENKAEETRKSAADMAENYTNNATELKEQIDNYIELQSKLDTTNLTQKEEKEIKNQLLEIQNKLIETYGDEADKLDLVNGKMQEQISKSAQLTKQKAEEYVSENYSAYNDATRELANTKTYDILYGITPNLDAKSYRAISDMLKKEFGGFADDVAGAGAADKTTLKISVSTKDAAKQLCEISTKIKKMGEDGKISGDVVNSTLTQISKNIGSIDDEAINNWKSIVDTYDSATNVINSKVDTSAAEFEQLQATYNQIINNISAIETLSSAYDTLSAGESLSTDKLIELCDTYPELSQYISETGDITLKNGELAKQAAEEQLSANISTLESEQQVLNAKKDRSAEEEKQLQSINSSLAIYKQKLADVSNTDVKLDVTAAKKELDTLGKAFSTLHGGKELDLSTTLDLIQTYPQFAQSLAAGNTSIEAQEDCIKALFNAKKSEMLLSLEADEKETQSLLNSTKTKLDLINQQISAYAALGGGFGNLYGERSEEQKSLTEYQNKLQEIQAQISAINNISTDNYGNSSSDSTQKTNDALQEQLKLIEHRKAMNTLTYSEEISWLQLLLNKYAQTADERMSLEEKIYSAQQSLQAEVEKAQQDAVDAAQKAAEDQAQAYSNIYNDQLSQIEHLSNMEQLSNTQQLAWLQTLYSQYVLTGDERMSLEEKIYNLQKTITEEQQQAIKQQRSDELALLDHKKNMDQLSSEDELAWLRRIQRQYEVDANDKYSMEERIYNLKKQQAEELEKQQKEIVDAQLARIKRMREYTGATYEQELVALQKLAKQVKTYSDKWYSLLDEMKSVRSTMESERTSQWDAVGSGVVEALQNKYQEQKDMEEQRIDESIDSWKNWEDETVAAIQGQIDALDELADAQDSENKRQEYENKRQATELQLAYEKDEYNRAEMQKELNRLDNEEAERLAVEQRKKQKSDLQKQIDDAKELSSAKQDALSSEKEALNKNYEELMKNMNLEAEAYKYIASHSMEQIVYLIGSYAPEYEGLGKTLGEKLYDGMKSSIKYIDSYMTAIKNATSEYQYYLELNANAAADKFWQSRASYEANILNNSAAPAVQDVSVNMTVNFNDKVDSPSAVAKKMEQVTQQIISEIKK